MGVGAHGGQRTTSRISQEPFLSETCSFTGLGSPRLRLSSWIANIHHQAWLCVDAGAELRPS